MRNRIPIFILILLTAIFTAGCITDLHPIPNVQAGNDLGQIVEASLVSAKGEYSVARGCYWTAQYQVFNKGTTTTKNVQIQVELVNGQTNAVRDSKSVFVGTIAPGESRTVTVDLDGECFKEYGLRAIPVFG